MIEELPSEKSIHIAAQCWCDDETREIEMDVRLALAFAKRLDIDRFAIAELTERNIALAAENENLKTYGSKPCPICDDYFEENDKLRTANAELVEALKTACNYLEQGKAKFAPSTTNYFVDDFIAKHGSTGWNGSEKL